SVVFIVEPASGANRDRADLVVLRRDAKYLAVGGSVVADGADVLAVNHWRDRAQGASFPFDREVVVKVEVVRLPALQAALDGRNASREHEHDVLAQGGELPDL